jgi:hypothetical protein
MRPYQIQHRAVLYYKPPILARQRIFLLALFLPIRVEKSFFFAALTFYSAILKLLLSAKHLRTTL